MSSYGSGNSSVVPIILIVALILLGVGATQLFHTILDKQEQKEISDNVIAGLQNELTNAKKQNNEANESIQKLELELEKLRQELQENSQKSEEQSKANEDLQNQIAFLIAALQKSEMGRNDALNSLAEHQPTETANVDALPPAPQQSLSAADEDFSDSRCILFQSGSSLPSLQCVIKTLYDPWLLINLLLFVGHVTGITFFLIYRKHFKAERINVTQAMPSNAEAPNPGQTHQPGTVTIQVPRDKVREVAKLLRKK